MSQCTNVKTWLYHFLTAGTEHSPAETGDRHSRSRQAGTGAEWDCSGPGYPQSKTSPGISNKTNTSNLLYTCIYNTGIDSKIWISLPLSTEMQWSFSLTYSFVLQHSCINKTVVLICIHRVTYPVESHVFFMPVVLKPVLRGILFNNKIKSVQINM